MSAETPTYRARHGSVPWRVLRALPSSGPQLALKLRVSPRQVQQALERLARAGAIRRIGAVPSGNGLAALWDRTREGA
jgi:DNA-binding Lrp family transcriptional regulator